MNSKPFKDRMNELVEEYGSAAEVARLSGISEGAVRKYRDGRSEPNISRLQDLSNGLDVSLLWLATGEGSKQPAKPYKLIEQQGQAENVIREDPSGRIGMIGMQTFPRENQSGWTTQEIEAARQRLERAGRIWESAIRIAGYEPPAAIAEGVKTLIYMEEASSEQLVMLLRAMKAESATESTKSKKSSTLHSAFMIRLSSIRKTIDFNMTDEAQAALAGLFFESPPSEDRIRVFLETFRTESERNQFDLDARIKELSERIRTYGHIWKEAADALDWTPPPRIATAIHRMICADCIQSADVAVLLKAIHEECGK